MAQEKKRGSLNLPLMIVAFLAMGAFLFWLNVTSEPTEFAIAEEREAEEETPAQLVQLSALQQDASTYDLTRVRVRDARVSLLVGSGAFMVESSEEGLPPFLIRIDPVQVDEEVTVLPQDRVTVAGLIQAMSDSVISAWEEQGVFTQEGQRALAEFAIYFLEADEIEVRTATPQGDGGGTGTDDEEDTGSGA